MNVRPLVDDDAPTVAALISAEEERLYGRPGRLTGADILMFLQWSKESWVWEDDSRMVASASYGVHGEAANIRGIVADKGRGLGTEIVERGEAFAVREGTKKIQAGAPEPDAAARALFESHGYREVRRFYEMAIELTEEPAAPVLPAGLVLDELREDEYDAFYDVLNEAFAEHWEWHPDPYDEWLERRKGQHRDEHGPHLVRRPRRRRARRRHAQRCERRRRRIRRRDRSPAGLARPGARQGASAEDVRRVLAPWHDARHARRRLPERNRRSRAVRARRHARRLVWRRLREDDRMSLLRAKTGRNRLSRS